MKYADWRSRLCAGSSFFLVSWVHHQLYSGVFKNTPELMLAYHGSAALCDFGIIVIAAHCLKGQLSRDIQRLNLCAIVVNFMGWLAYLAWTSPVMYNIAIAGLYYVQWVRLLWVDDNASNPVGRHLVRRGDTLSRQLRF